MNKKITRLTYIILLPILLIYPLQFAAAESKTIDPLDMYYPMDIEEHWAYDELDNFVNADILRGYIDQHGVVTIKPNNPISRAEFVSILVRTLGLTSDLAGKTFNDVTQSKWYYETVRIASSLGIVSGITETNFGPDRLITRGEIATLIVRAFEASVTFEGEAKLFTDVPQYFATEAIAKASGIGIVYGATDTEFKPFANAKRAEAVVMLERALNQQRSNLPDDILLTSFVLQAEAEEYQIFINKEYTKLFDMNKTYFTAYHLAFTNMAYASINELTKNGFEITMKQIGEPTAKVVNKSDRFAIVETIGGSYGYSLYDGTNKQSEIKTTSGILMLKKVSDNSWKIYAYYPY